MRGYFHARTQKYAGLVCVHTSGGGADDETNARDSRARDNDNTAWALRVYSPSKSERVARACTVARSSLVACNQPSVHVCVRACKQRKLVGHGDFLKTYRYFYLLFRHIGIGAALFEICDNGVKYYR